MRCQDVKRWLIAQHESEQPSDLHEVHAHLRSCPPCRRYWSHQQRLDTLFHTQAQGPRTFSSISTERIMLAIQQQQRITQQLEDIRTKQRTRMARMRVVGIPLFALVFLSIGSIPLLLLALTIVQPDLLVNILSLLSSLVALLLILAQYLQAGLAMVTRDARLSALVALAVVLMMGMWLRLMRHPQEA